MQTEPEIMVAPTRTRATVSNNDGSIGAQQTRPEGCAWRVGGGKSDPTSLPRGVSGRCIDASFWLRNKESLTPDRAALLHLLLTNTPQSDFATCAT